MATIIQRGLASVNGVAGTFDVLAYPVQQSLKVTQAFEEEMVKDVNGFTAALLARDEHATADIALKFTGDTAAHAKVPATSAGLLGQPFLAPYASVTLSSFTMASLNGVWQVITGTDFDQGNTKVADGTYKLRRWADSTQNTSLNAAPA